MRLARRGCEALSLLQSDVRALRCVAALSCAAKHIRREAAFDGDSEAAHDEQPGRAVRPRVDAHAGRVLEGGHKRQRAQLANLVHRHRLDAQGSVGRFEADGADGSERALGAKSVALIIASLSIWL